MTWNQTEVARQLKIKYPIILAGMAGGATTPELVAAVSHAGGLGTLGAGYMAPEHMRLSIHKIRELTPFPFGVNLFIPERSAEMSDEKLRSMKEILKPYREKLGIEGEFVLGKVAESFEEQVQVLLDEKVPVFSFTFGIPSMDLITEFKRRNIILIGTATTVREAQALEESGVDMIVGQGYEAGGHRGTFLESTQRSLIGTMGLIPQITDYVSIPVIAAGGIMDGRGIAAALMLGAKGVQLGTAFLTCEESGAHHAYKKAIAESTEESTVLTRSFSGKQARGIENQFIREMERYGSSILDYPIQNAITRDLRQAAAQRNNQEFMSLWAGQATRLSTEESAAAFMDRIIEETAKILSR